MKNYIFSIILLIAGVTATTAQTETSSFNVDSIKVIFKPTQKNIVSVRLYFRAGVSNYPSSQAGIESFAIEATTQCGTKKYTANEFKDIEDKYSILIGGSSTRDYGFIEINCLTKYFNTAWDLFTESVINPAFEVNEVELLKNKFIARTKSRQSSPDTRVADLLMQNAFENTPYATEPDGTEETLAALTASDLKNYYSTILNKNQIFIVVVGNINKDELAGKVRTSFASVPVKPFTPVSYQIPAFIDYKLLVEKRDIATNYIRAAMNAPKFTNADYVPYFLGMSEFSGALFHQLRTKLNLSYAPGAGVAMLQMPFSQMFVSTTKPKEAVQEMTSLLKRFRAITLSEQSLIEMKSGFITRNYLKQQSSAAIAASLGNAEILGGWEYEENLPAMVINVTGEQINHAFNKYIVGLKWSYLGNPQLAAAAADAFKQPVN